VEKFFQVLQTDCRKLLETTGIPSWKNVCEIFQEIAAQET